MRALVYTDTETLIYREEKNPKLDKNESLVKVSASGICGSDMHAYHGRDDRRIPPLILGHEVSGVITQGKLLGKKVVINPLITCGECNYCKNGKEHLCPKRIILGMNKPIERQGALAELVSIPDKNIYELPNDLDIKEAPIAEPTAVALHAVELYENSQTKLNSAINILVIGGGAIGLLCGLILSKVKNFKNITITEPNNKRLNECAKYLKAKALDPNDQLIKDNSFNVIFDTVGLEATRLQSIKCVKPGGSIIHIGLTQPSGSFDFRKTTLQEITITGTYCYTNKDFENTLNILAQKKLGNLGWIKYKNLKDGADAFKEIHDGRCIAPKIILIP